MFTFLQEKLEKLEKQKVCYNIFFIFKLNYYINFENPT